MNDLFKSLDHASRREMLQHAAKACLGVTAVSAVAGGTPIFAGENAAKGKAKHVIYLYMSGGMSHIDTWDPKPGTDVAGEFDPIRTKTKGVQISDRLPKLAKQMDKVCLIRSMNSSQGAHDRASYLMHTSYAPLASVKHPGMGPWITKLSDRLNHKLPGSVVVGGGSRASGAGVLGSAYEPIVIGNPEQGLQNSEMARGVSESDFSNRRRLLDTLDRGFRTRYPQKKVQAYTRFYQEAVALMQSEDVKAFDISAESSKVKQAYGANNFGMGCLLARRLVQAGVRFVEVNFGGWDTHQDNFENLTEKLPAFDQGIAALLDDLSKQGMLDDTLVVQTSEFGRTPKINERTGRDHFPKAFTTMLAGGGVRGGQVHGSTDKTGSAPTDTPVTPQDFNATIAHAMGVNYKKQIFTKIGRPFTMSDKGKPVTAIF